VISGPHGLVLALCTLHTLLSCGTASTVTEAGNCRFVWDDKSDEYVRYVADVGRTTGCDYSDFYFWKCPAPIKLEFVDYPLQIARDAFEPREHNNHDYPRAHLRVTNIAGYDLWLSQSRHDLEGWDVQFRDQFGHVLNKIMFRNREFR
jgi:hypothetical protein